MTPWGLFLNSSSPTCIEVARRSAAFSAAANCSGVAPYRPAVSTCVTPIARVSLNIAPGSFCIERRLQSCSPMGAPTEPMVRVLVAMLTAAGDGDGEPTVADREQAIAG